MEEWIQHRAESAFFLLVDLVSGLSWIAAMSGIEVSIKYGSYEGVTAQIYFIDMTKRIGSAGNVGTIRLSNRVKITYHSEN
ncbi:hypothetical protein NST94_03495 [Paenibacillus sp. FSL H8-0282]|uniref:hypothetical protein n=1 Tax=Paenibacillus sp. FSL H8-0282 TaxID=2954741 RepID=UPI0030D88B65